jgi:hypothetical protein
MAIYALTACQLIAVKVPGNFMFKVNLGLAITNPADARLTDLA